MILNEYIDIGIGTSLCPKQRIGKNKGNNYVKIS